MIARRLTAAARTANAIAVAVAVLLASPCARAQPDPSPPSRVAACDAPRSTVDALGVSLAQQVAQALGRAAGPIGDVAVVSRSALPASAPRAEELIEALVGPAVAAIAALPNAGRVDRSVDAAQDVDDLIEAVATATRAGHERLVVVRVGLEGNYLVVQARVLTTERRWWRRRGTPPGTRLGSPWLRARLDVELRSYVGMLPPVEGARVSARHVPLPASGYLALQVLDVDGDELNEIVLLRAGAVEVLRLRAGRGSPPPTVVARAALDALGRASSPRRRAIGALAIHAEPGDVRIVGRTSEQATAFRVTWSGTALSLEADATEGYPLGRCTSARLVSGRDYFEPTLLSSCAGVAPPGAATSAFYGRASTRLHAGPNAYVPLEVVTATDGTMRLRVGGAAPETLPDAGTAVALADVNDDGSAEVLSSSPADIGARDRLTLRIVGASGEHRVSWSSAELAGSVLVAGSGDVDSDGLVDLLAVEEPAPGSTRSSRLWIVR